MCTLSWLPEDEGYLLLFNRDERRARAPARPPELSSLNAVRAIAPIDGDHGGTWVGVNELGVTTGLLNRYQPSAAAQPVAPVSRGLLVAELLDASSVAQVADRVRRRALGQFRPFTMVSVESGGPVALFDWDGDRLIESSVTAAGIVRVSSGVSQDEADRSRRAVLKGMLGERPLNEAVLVELHRSHLPERGARAVCMHRDEASTVSLTMVRVAKDAVAIEYTPGPPCVTASLPRVRLPRRAA